MSNKLWEKNVDNIIITIQPFKTQVDIIDLYCSDNLCVNVKINKISETKFHNIIQSYATLHCVNKHKMYLPTP